MKSLALDVKERLSCVCFYARRRVCSFSSSVCASVFEEQVSFLSLWAPLLSFNLPISFSLSLPRPLYWSCDRLSLTYPFFPLFTVPLSHRLWRRYLLIPSGTVFSWNCLTPVSICPVAPSSTDPVFSNAAGTFLWDSPHGHRTCPFGPSCASCQPFCGFILWVWTRGICVHSGWPRPHT